MIWRNGDLNTSREQLFCERDGQCPGVATAEHLALTREGARTRLPDVVFTTTKGEPPDASRTVPPFPSSASIRIRPGGPAWRCWTRCTRTPARPGRSGALVIRRWRHALGLTSAPVCLVGLSATLEEARSFLASSPAVPTSPGRPKCPRRWKRRSRWGWPTNSSCVAIRQFAPRSSPPQQMRPISCWPGCRIPFPRPASRLAPATASALGSSPSPMTSTSLTACTTTCATPRRTTSSARLTAGHRLEALRARSESQPGTARRCRAELASRGRDRLAP